MASRFRESHSGDIEDLEQLLQRIDAAVVERGYVTLGAVMDQIGRRSFGPLLLLAGLVTVMPLVGDIPGVPTLFGLLVLTVTVQLLLGRRSYWLPRVLLERSVRQDRLCKAMAMMKRPARHIDRLLRPRLRMFAEGPAEVAIALACSGIALTTPLLELVPFSANVAGAALMFFGLALIARDGLVALVAFSFTAVTAGWLATALIG